MRWKMPASVLAALAFLIPAAPATAQAAQPGLDAGCQTVERAAYTDLRERLTLDLDTATDVEVRVLADQLLSTAKAESLPVLPDAIQERLDGTPEDLRKFLRDDVRNAWSVALRVTVVRTLTDAGASVQEAAKKVLENGTDDVYLAYLNEGLYDARELDCASQPTPTPTATPSATTTATPTTGPTTGPSASATPGSVGGGDGELPRTGAGTLTMIGAGVALVVLGIAGYLIGRSRKSRFVA